MSMKRIFLSTLIFSIFVNAFAFDWSIFNSKLSADEKIKLESGELIIRNVDTKKNMCSTPDTSAPVKKIWQGVNKLNPNYTVEVIRMLKDNPERQTDVLDQLNDCLLNLNDYAGIPYWSVHAQRYFNLYDKVTEKTKTTQDTTTKILAEYVMKPFGTFDCDIVLDYDTQNKCIFYDCVNIPTLRYKDQFNCIKPGRMHIYISSFKHDGATVLYAVGAVDAPSIFFLRNRVETSFINRINTFCSYMFNKFE